MRNHNNQLSIPAMEKRSFSNLKPLNVPYGSKEAVSESPFTVVNTPGCGKRITIGKSFMEHLGSPETIQISVDDDGIIITKALSEEATKFRLRKSGKKPCVYSSSLVDTLTEEFNLDFSNRTSISFQEVEGLSMEGEPVVFVLLREEQPVQQEPTSEVDGPAPAEVGIDANPPAEAPLQEGAQADEEEAVEQGSFGN